MNLVTNRGLVFAVWCENGTLLEEKRKSLAFFETFLTFFKIAIMTSWILNECFAQLELHSSQNTRYSLLMWQNLFMRIN